ncbi:MAG TPA: hypothetical protein VGE45_10225 [Chloroflexia bacterium]|jgi:hypothetical protein
MAEDQGKEHDKQQKVHRADQSTTGPEGSIAPENTPTYPTSLLNNPALGGRGNAPVRAAIMRQMQQTYGNKAVQRYLQRARDTATPVSDKGLDVEQTPDHAHSTPVQRTGPTTTPTAPPTAPVVTVDRIDIVDSASGAIGGFPAITSGDLNTPGPYNDATTGAVKNAHQIHFHLDQGDSSMLTPRRELQRSFWAAGIEHKNPPDRPLPPGEVGPPTPGGYDGVIVGPDGPPPHEIQRPSTDKIVVADAPGARALVTAQYPYTYRSHFTLIVADSGGRDIAKVTYDVWIEKTSAADVPNTHNSITATSKEDLVRGQSLQ